MNKKETKRLAATIAASANQSEGILAYLAEGNTITADGARQAGIADPRRVVNHLRNAGVKIDRSVNVGRRGTAIVYALAPAKRGKKSAR
jgi:tetraacyldisaccharide-1-P 4'-kinase